MSSINSFAKIYKMCTHKKTILRLYKESDWESVRNFIHTNWRQNHPICRKELFDWQHKGFGYESEEIGHLVLLHNDEVVGFRGVTPGLYQVPSIKNKIEIVKGGSSTTWMVRDDFRGIASFKMNLKTLQMLPIITAAGININTAMKFHQRNGFVVLDAIHRYIVPLNEKCYQKLLAQNSDFNEIKDWAKIVRQSVTEIVKPTTPDLNAIAEVWEKTTFPKEIFSLYRNAEFWKWRYLDSAGFSYLFFGDPECTGVVVARIEKIISDHSNPMDKKKVFRIIEIIPRNSIAWEGKADGVLVEMILGVLNWAVDQECIMADFHCSSNRFGSTLSTIGFRNQNNFMNDPIFSLPALFQPLEYNFPPMNVAFRIVPGKGFRNTSWNNTYIVKSENDQDRPNI